jgi:putative ABC transport system permease protein
MRFARTIQVAWHGLRTNTARSLLTVLGIVIGIAAIILIVSIGQGTERFITSEIQGMGANTIIVRPGKEPTGPTDAADMLFSDSLKISDIDALRRQENVPDIETIAPVVMISGSVSYGNETYRPIILGWDASFMGKVMGITPRSGEYFSDIDIRSKANVAVIGAKVEHELFGGENALGKNIKIKNNSFRVIAVLAPHGQSTFFNVDEIIVIPYTTAQAYLLGINYFHEVMIQIRDAKNVESAVRDIEKTLRERHNIIDPQKDDFFVVTQEGIIDQIGAILGVLTIFLSSVVAISLVVGGIGVMNIMLVSVTERTREIGLRKALGARNKDILLQFLTEAILLTGAGGIVGIMLGIACSLAAGAIITQILGRPWEFAFPYTAAVLGISVSVIVGLIFGIYPARKASLKNPIEALRYE